MYGVRTLSSQQMSDGIEAEDISQMDLLGPADRLALLRYKTTTVAQGKKKETKGIAKEERSKVSKKIRLKERKTEQRDRKAQDR